MAEILKDASYIPLPSNFKRGNPIPLDTSAVWYSYEEMVQYTRFHPTAYVGQILGLVDEANNTTEAYIVLNKAGDVERIGAAAINTDNRTIALSDGTTGLKDFGKQYYRRIEMSDGSISYELQLVDEEHPWNEGLEPKVVLQNGEMVLGWFEPNTTTIEGVSTQIVNIQNNIAALEETKVSKEEGKSLVSDTEIAKLSTIQENAEPNIISSVDAEDFGLSSLKKLFINKVDSSKIKNLSSHQTIMDLRTGVDKNASTLEQLNTMMTNNATNIANNANRISTVADQLNNYVLQATYEAKMATIEMDIEDLKDRLSWKTFERG